MKPQRSTIFATGLALFSMFFGAGNLIFPLRLGNTAGDNTGFALLGLLVTAVVFPLVGLLAMMLFQGDYRSFFLRIGRMPGLVLLFVVQVVLGPLGSIPRLIALSYATLKPYLPEVSLAIFSLLAGGVIFALTIKRHRIVDLLGYILTPLLLLSLGSIVVIGLMDHPPAILSEAPPLHSFFDGLKEGYNTLDLIASFLFATLIALHFQRETKELGPKEAARQTMKRFLKASLIAASLLGITYAGLGYISSFYTPTLEGIEGSEDLLSAISRTILGPLGGVIASVAVAMACLTTAISLAAIFADYIQKDLSKGKIKGGASLAITLAISCLVANLGFGGIAKMLGPILEVCYPGLIVLSLLNIAHKLTAFKPVKIPVALAFTVALVGYFI